MIHIKSRHNGDIILSLNVDSLAGSNLRHKDMADADLSEQHLCLTDFYGANLEFANLSRSNLRRSCLNRADLSIADLGGADLRFASLKKANLSYCNLEGANLFGADFRAANLSGTRGILSAQFDPRGHTLILWHNEHGIQVKAGCRDFSLQEAFDHWAHMDYPDHKRGDAYCYTIRALANIMEDNLNA